MALPSTKTQTEPISLELFNRAAVDLDKKGEIELNITRNTYLIVNDGCSF